MPRPTDKDFLMLLQKHKHVPGPMAHEHTRPALLTEARIKCKCGHLWEEHCGNTYTVGQPEPHNCSQGCGCPSFRPDGALWLVLRREGTLDPQTIDYRTTILRRCKTEQEAERAAREMQRPLTNEEADQ